MPAKYDRIYDGMRKAFFISLVLTGFAAVVCVFFGRAIVGLFLTAPTEEVFSYAMVYLRTISVFFFFLSILYLYRTSLQGLGKGMVPMIGGILELDRTACCHSAFCKRLWLSGRLPCQPGCLDLSRYSKYGCLSVMEAQDQESSLNLRPVYLSA